MLVIEIFKALSDETRLRSILLLLKYKELCVCDLEKALDLAQPKISRHLAILKSTGLVTTRREGLWIHYRISEKLSNEIKTLLNNILLEEESQNILAQDEKRLNKATSCEHGGYNV